MKSMIKTTLKQGALIAAATMSISAWAGVVSVSNYPLALLSNAVTQGDHDAEVLLGAGDVGHHGALSPSKVKLVEDSQFVVWFGGDLEQNLVKSLDNAPNAISLLKFNAFTRHPLRNIDGTARTNTQDPHIWLDPTNAKAIVKALAVIHGHANPASKAKYQANADDFIKKMDAAVAEVGQTQVQPYWAYHDAFQYIETAAKLKFAGALTPDHHISPKASQIKHLSDTRPKPAMCLASQGPVSDGIKNKLGNVTVSIQQEDMSGGGDDFVEIWKQVVSDLQACAGT